nr:cytochrome c biogenesis protein ccmB [Eriocaulon australe]
MCLRGRIDRGMKVSFLNYLINGWIFPSTPPITSFFLFLSYIVVTPLIIGFEKDFSCNSHLGSIWIPLLFPFPPEPFPRNDKESGTLELYYLSASCSQKILLLQLVGHRFIQISRVFCAFPMLQLPYQFDRSGMDRLNILLGSLVLTLLCGIHSRLALGITSSSGWNSSQNPTTSPTSLPPTVSRTSIETEGFHVLSSIGYSSPFVSPYPISVSISSQDGIGSIPATTYVIPVLINSLPKRWLIGPLIHHIIEFPDKTKRFFLIHFPRPMIHGLIVSLVDVSDQYHASSHTIPLSTISGTSTNVSYDSLLWWSPPTRVPE